MLIDTSPLLYLHRISKLDWLPEIFTEIIVPSAVVDELREGKQAAIALALENSESVVLLDDGLARITAQALGLTVWGTLKILLRAKGTDAA
ncbi:MAG: hypothetical protein WA865_20200 [Spirulinaceae cyanobacterium]